MALRLKPLSDQVIVITGASSGIGLATARMAAAQGAAVVLAARTEEALNKAVQEIAAAGGRAIAVICDVGRRDDLEYVAAEAVRSFGRIDTWVNNAGVGIWGRIEEVSEADMRQLFETNFWGQVNGSLIALRQLRQHGGALINVGSIASDRAIPLQGIYSASKHAIKGFTDALRMELEEEDAPVSITLIKPGSIGTPMPQHIRNYTNNEPKFPPPVYAPEDVAKVILHAATYPTRDAFVGGAARTVSTLAKIAPRVLDRASESTLFKGQLGPKPPSAGDNLWNGRSEGEVRGDHQGRRIRRSLYSNAALHPVLSMIAAGLALTTIGWLASNRRRDGAQSGSSLYDAGLRYREQLGAWESEADADPEITGLLDETVLVETISHTGVGLPDETLEPALTPEEMRRVAEESGAR
jgi:short-subunit dehydrogenase